MSHPKPEPVTREYEIWDQNDRITAVTMPKSYQRFDQHFKALGGRYQKQITDRPSGVDGWTFVRRVRPDVEKLLSQIENDRISPGRFRGPRQDRPNRKSLNEIVNDKTRDFGNMINRFDKLHVVEDRTSFPAALQIIFTGPPKEVEENVKQYTDKYPPSLYDTRNVFSAHTEINSCVQLFRFKAAKSE